MAADATTFLAIYYDAELTRKVDVNNFQLGMLEAAEENTVELYVFNKSRSYAVVELEVISDRMSIIDGKFKLSPRSTKPIKLNVTPRITDITQGEKTTGVLVISGSMMNDKPQGLVN